MTEKQKKQIQTAKLNDQRAAYTNAFMSTPMRDRRNLIAIIDGLQQPKRYTEAELRAEFKNQPIDTVCPPPNEPQIVGRGSLYGWIAAFRFLGMIKTEGES